MVLAKVLLVDEDIGTARYVQPVLVQEGYQVDHVLPGRDAIRQLLVEEPDLVILGVGAEEGAWQFCRQLLTFVEQPVLLLLATEDRLDRVKGLDLGADDCMIKPPPLVELIARMRALLRRGTPRARSRQRSFYRDGELMVDFARREVKLGGRPVALTPTEFRLLLCLVQNPDEVLSHEQLLARVWGPDCVESRNILKQHIHNLRQKLEPDPRRPQRIVSRWGEGYLFKRIALEP
jgi:two-component system KDP operon response regulator KdpE